MIRRLLFLPILAAAAGAFALLSAFGPEPVAGRSETPPPLVRVETVRLAPRRPTVRAHGVVRPARRTTVAAEVAGRVAWAAPGLRNGARVASGAALFRIEPLDYELRVAQAESALAEAGLLAARERAAARLARAEWADEAGGPPDPLALREPQLAAAEAALRAAGAALESAERDLERTEVLAPHAGLVGERSIEVGEWAAPGRPLVELLSVATAEVRVSLPDAAVGLVEVPFGGASGGPPPRARLLPAAGAPGTRSGTPSGTPSGTQSEMPSGAFREGRLVRVESEVDPATRFHAAVVEVAGPYRTAADGGPPLVFGSSVEVLIEGREFPAAASLPESAFREDGAVLVVDADDRLRLRTVDALRIPLEDGRVLVRSGLADGDRVVTAPPPVVAEGMPVRVEAAPPPRGGAPPVR